MEARKKRPSRTHCAAMWCNNYVGCRADKISLHRFPKCPTRCAKWLDFCGRRDLLGKSPIDLRHHKVCSDHFIQPYFKLNGSRIVLEPYAVPTVLVKGAPGSQDLTDVVAACSPSLPPLVAEEVCWAVEPNVSEMEQECGGDMGTPQKRKSSCDSSSTPKRQRSSGRSNPTPRTEKRLRSYRRSISNLRSRLFKCKNLGNTRNKNRMRDIIEASNVYLPESCHKFLNQKRQAEKIAVYDRVTTNKLAKVKHL